MSIEENLAKHQRRIGITGGIASGKSTIATYIEARKNFIVLNADLYNRELLNTNNKILEQITSYFGKRIIKFESNKKIIDTNILKKLILNNTERRNWLENLLHPLIKEKMIKDCRKYRDQKILILEIPLLFEANFENICTEIWLIKCSKKIQKQRLMSRDNISEIDAENILLMQTNNINKEKKSNVILINDEQNKNLLFEKIEDLI
tara:strand:+ start:1808 stop:2425 length:618 start_codon:yes stop_codon:yes gene_type:complete